MVAPVQETPITTPPTDSISVAQVPTPENFTEQDQENLTESLSGSNVKTDITDYTSFNENKKNIEINDILDSDLVILLRLSAACALPCLGLFGLMYAGDPERMAKAVKTRVNDCLNIPNDIKKSFSKLVNKFKMPRPAVARWGVAGAGLALAAACVPLVAKAAAKKE